MLLPSFLHVAIRKLLLGASIEDGARISIGTYLKCKCLKIDKNAKLGPFSAVIGTDVVIGAEARVKPISLVRSHTIRLGSRTHIAPLSITSASTQDPRASFELGERSRIFPFCWLEPGRGIKIGRHVGVGGHSLIFTHGAWSDYLNGGPVAFGPVTIEDHVWLPWRVFILPNVRIGRHSIIGANSTVSRSVPENSLAAGSPAKVLKENVIPKLTPNEKLERAESMLKDLADLLQAQKISFTLEKSRIHWDHTLAVDDESGLSAGDFLLLVTDSLSSEDVLRLTKQGVTVIDHPQLKYYRGAGWIDPGSFELVLDHLGTYGIRLDQGQIH